MKRESVEDRLLFVETIMDKILDSAARPFDGDRLDQSELSIYIVINQSQMVAWVRWSLADIECLFWDQGKINEM